MRPKPPVFETRRAILLCINAPQTHQSAAGHYVKEGSFTLRYDFDRFLYETTERRKLETQNNTQNKQEKTN